jgi:carbon-monoxide dehydrogenase small subunit
MTPVSLTVNGRRVSAMVEPRTHLGDFLREHCRLTGTHLGCEHGVCGACTVLLDGEPVRSCIAYTVACDGQEVRTIEGLGSDPIMQRLHDAFSREHALQCGFCTPGMLISARDIVQRLPGADENRIRRELAGNLCRCTGYLGIVQAVRSVAQGEAGAPTVASTPGPASKPMGSFLSARETVEMPLSEPARTQGEHAGPREGWSRFEESFLVERPSSEVWRLFDNIPVIAACLPGARLSEHDARSAKGTMAVKFGPITAQFAGSAIMERDERGMRGTIRGAGNDRGSGSRTHGEVFYQLIPENGRTRVSLIVEYNVQGMLAQFSRPKLVQDLGRRLVREFAANLNGKLSSEEPAPARSVSLNLINLLPQSLWERLCGLFKGRSPD